MPSGPTVIPPVPEDFAASRSRAGAQHAPCGNVSLADGRCRDRGAVLADGRSARRRSALRTGSVLRAALSGLRAIQALDIDPLVVERVQHADHGRTRLRARSLDTSEPMAELTVGPTPDPTVEPVAEPMAEPTAGQTPDPTAVVPRDVVGREETRCCRCVTERRRRQEAPCPTLTHD